MLGSHFDNLFSGLPVTGLEVPVHGNLGPGLEEGEGQFGQGSPNSHAQAFQVLLIGEDEPQEGITTFPVGTLEPVVVNVLADRSRHENVVGCRRWFGKVAAQAFLSLRTPNSRCAAG